MTAVDNTASNALPSLWSSKFQVVNTQRERLLVQNAGMGDLEICRATTWRPTIRMIATVALLASESPVLRDRDIGSLESQGQDIEGSCVCASIFLCWQTVSPAVSSADPQNPPYSHTTIAARDELCAKGTGADFEARKC